MSAEDDLLSTLVPVVAFDPQNTAAQTDRALPVSTHPQNVSD